MSCPNCERLQKLIIPDMDNLRVWQQSQDDYRELAKLRAENQLLTDALASANQLNEKLRGVLERIRDLDYRGNRELGSVIAFEALRGKDWHD